MQKRDVLIIGAGIGGMQAALNVADKGFKVVLLDKSLSVGGSMVKTGFKDRAVDTAVRQLEQTEETGAALGLPVHFAIRICSMVLHEVNLH